MKIFIARSSDAKAAAATHFGDEAFFSDDPVVRKKRKRLYKAKLVQRIGCGDKEVYRCNIEWVVENPYKTLNIQLSPLSTFLGYDTIPSQDKEIKVGSKSFIISERKVEVSNDGEGNVYRPITSDKDVFASYTRTSNGDSIITVQTEMNVTCSEIYDTAKMFINLSLGGNSKSFNKNALLKNVLKPERISQLNSLILERFELEINSGEYSLNNLPMAVYRKINKP